MHVLSRHRTPTALACLITVAFAAQPLAALAQTAPGKILFQRPMSGLYAGSKTVLSLAIFSIGDDGFGERQLTPFVPYQYDVPGLSTMFHYSSTGLTNAFSPSGNFSVMLDAHSQYPLYGGGPYHGKYFIINNQGDRTTALFPGSDDLEKPSEGPARGSVTWGPAGTNEIAYTNSQDLNPHAHPACIRLMHPDGTGNHTLWCAPRWDYRGVQALRWSGDGRNLLATAVRTDSGKGVSYPLADLYLVDSSTGAATLVEAAIPAPFRSSYSSDVSYDGHEVIFAVTYDTHEPGPCVVTSSLNPAIWCAKNMLTGQTVALVDPTSTVAFERGALLSPDGNHVYLPGTTNHAATNPEYELYAIGTDGTGLRKVTEPCAAIDEGISLSWYPIRLSPDGSQVLANCEVDQYPPAPPTRQTRIYVVNLADGSSRYVTHGVAYDWHVPSM